jgi:hypothetical protein
MLVSFSDSYVRFYVVFGGEALLPPIAGYPDLIDTGSTLC